MKKLTQDELDNLIQQHEIWLKNNELGIRPSFSNLDLSELELKRANLYHSNFTNSNLTRANFRNSNLEKADLGGAILEKTNLIEANLFHANLYKAILKNVKVNEYTMFYFLICPEEGEIIGYKKAITKDKKYAIVKLLIPKEARRNSATTYRCRADKAKVLEIISSDNEIIDKAWSNRKSNFIYETNKLLEVPEFDEDRWHETASGIHFFMSKDLAKLY